jgi:hypothetical protein
MPDFPELRYRVLPLWWRYRARTVRFSFNLVTHEMEPLVTEAGDNLVWV